jgi:hypothetical protein
MSVNYNFMPVSERRHIKKSPREKKREGRISGWYRRDDGKVALK